MFAELVSLGAAPGRGEAPSVGAGSVDHALGYKMYISNIMFSIVLEKVPSEGS